MLKFYFVSLFLSFTLSLHAAISTQELELIQKKIKERDSMSISFTQTVFRSLRKTSSTKKGHAYFIKPNKFRWELEDHWIFDGKNLTIYHPKEKEAVRYSSAGLKAKELRQIVDMVLNAQSLFSQYSVEQANQVKNDLVLTLKPKKTDEIMSAYIEIDLNKNYVKTIELTLKGNNKTTFKFTDAKPITQGDQFLILPKNTKISEAL